MEMGFRSMKIVGLCKTFSGHEFIEAAIEELYGFLDKIVFVHSEISWTGKTGNTVKPVIDKWQKENDKDNKIIHLYANVKSQEEQYKTGYEYIINALKPDWIMMFDSDEVWDYMGLNMAKKILNDSVEYNSIAAKMHTYLKSPLYRVFPAENCEPTVFIRPILPYMMGIRGNKVMPRLRTDMYFHHFTYVRDNEKDIFDKIQTSLLGDREDVPQINLVDIEKWKQEKWNNILTAKNLHTTKAYEWSWYQCKKVTVNDLPKSCRNLPIVKIWEEK